MIYLADIGSKFLKLINTFYRLYFYIIGCMYNDHHLFHKIIRESKYIKYICKSVCSELLSDIHISSFLYWRYLEGFDYNPNDFLPAF